MDISLDAKKTDWDNWLIANNGSFLQSWEWGEVLISEKKEVERILVMEGKEVVAQAQAVYTKLPLGMKYGFCAGGPVAKLTINKEKLASVWEYFKNYFFSKGVIFLRVEPPQLLIANCSLLISKTFDLTPRATTILDISKSEDHLLAGMHEKTRYNIRLAQKKGLIINTDKNTQIFLALSKKTAQRDGFHLHPSEHYEAVSRSALTRQITVFKNNIPIASALFVGFGNTFTYLFGASDHEFRSLMGPHLMQWEGIKMGKRLGYKYYDFFGIAPQEQSSGNCHFERSEKSIFKQLDSRSATPQGRLSSASGLACLPEGMARNDSYMYNRSHQYAGVTRFKLGFGGAIAEAPGTFDLIIFSLKYRIYQALRFIRRLF